ncbi:efflux RND transporter permease subunit [Halovenus salina]|uniref:RND family transporter n=1 Tax=Halovenus salina TaxID=1510225 RepID=A0ABD5VW73_9EURY
MNGGYSRRYAEWIATHSRLVIVAVVLVTVLVGAGAGMGDAGEAGVGEFEVDSEEFDAADFIDANYATDNTVAAQLVVRDEGGDVLTKDSLLAGLRLQEELRDNPEVESTLTERGIVGIENVVGTAAVYAGSDTPPTAQPPLERQREALAALSESEVEALLARVLDPDGAQQLLGDADPYALLPQGYEPGSTTATARLTFISQVDDSSETSEPPAAYDAQIAIDGLADEYFADAFVFGQGVRDEASSNATADSFAIITPFALVLILFVLGVSYRDVVDILLAVLGIVVVLVWLQGLMGWLAVPMNVILIAVPFLLIGLSIDYAVHVVMRYREARQGTLDVETDLSTGDGAIRGAMGLGLGSVVLALAAATFSTGVGFLSNVVSPLPAIQDFAVLSSGGIFATFVAFGAFLPALKIEVDGLLEGRFGRSRDKPAFGTSSGAVKRALGGVSAVATRAPVAVLVVALLLTTGGVVGATSIDTEFNQADFLPQDAPDWAEYLPGPFEPGTYTITDDFEYLSANFQIRGEGGQSTVLIRGDVTSPAMLAAADQASNAVTEASAIQRRPDGVGAVDGPQTAIREVAAENATFAAIVQQYDTDGDSLPDENVGAVYAALFEANEEAAAEVLSRDGEEITSARLQLSVRSSESTQRIATDTRAFADAVESNAAGVSLRAVATGPPVTEGVLQDALLETLVEAFVVTLVVILVFLTALFWVRYRSPTQGVVVVIPVVIALAWLLGAMALLDIPFNSETAVITSLAIGLGVDYSIHAGERFVAEREQRETVEEALQATATGTGGALLASAATTASGFGVLALSLSPPLRRFGTVTGGAIIFAFVSVVTVLPALFVLRERLVDRLQS